MRKYLKFQYVAIALIFSLSIGLYLNSLHHSFHFDDHPNIIENRYIRNLKDIPSFVKGISSYTGKFRVLSMFSFAVNYHLHGLNVYGYHVVNLALHIICGILVYFISRSLFGFELKRVENPIEGKNNLEDRKINFLSLLTSTIFIVHPIQANAVTNIVQRTEMLASLFYLLSIFLFLKGSLEKGWRKILFFLGTGISYLCAIFSKETGFTLPIVLIILDFLFVCKTKREIQKRFLIYLPLLLLLTIYISFFLKGGILRLFIKGSEEWMWTPWENLLTQANVIIQYFRLLFLPLPQWLNFDHDFRVSKSLFAYPTWISVSVILLLLISSAILIKKNRLIPFAIFFFFIVLAPSSSFIPLWDIMAEYRLYLPIFSYGLILTMGLNYLYQLLTRHYSQKLSQGTVLGISIVILCFYSVVTIERNKIFKDDVTLWSDVLKKSPDKARAHHNLGRAYLMGGDIDKALQEAEIALRLSDRHIRKESVKFILNLIGGAYLDKGEIDRALSIFHRAIEFDPNFATSYYNVSCIYSMKKEKTKTIEYLKKAIALDIRYKEKARVDQDFNSLRGEKDFEELVR
jgi:protein O-mannosyl-transferase